MKNNGVDNAQCIRDISVILWVKMVKWIRFFSFLWVVFLRVLCKKRILSCYLCPNLTNRLPSIIGMQ